MLWLLQANLQYYSLVPVHDGLANIDDVDINTMIYFYFTKGYRLENVCDYMIPIKYSILSLQIRYNLDIVTYSRIVSRQGRLLACM